MGRWEAPSVAGNNLKGKIPQMMPPHMSLRSGEGEKTNPGRDWSQKLTELIMPQDVLMAMVLCGDRQEFQWGGAC